MGGNSRSRLGQVRGTGKDFSKEFKAPKSRVPTSASSSPAFRIGKLPSPATDTPGSEATRQKGLESSSSIRDELVSEIVVRIKATDTDESMDVEMPDAHPAAPHEASRSPLPGSLHMDSIAQETGPHASSMSAVSYPSDLSSLSSLSSKATTPVDADSSRETGTGRPKTLSGAGAGAVRETPRRRYDVRPRISIPSDMAPQEYAMQCIAAAESSRLNPYALHPDEYSMLRDHISHAQVTTYLNIRNGILRLWIRNVQIAVTREEAIGCAKDARWFDVASVCFDWLVRNGYINHGCVEIRWSKRSPDAESPKRERRRRVVVIGAGMSGLGCARQLEALFSQYRQRLHEQGENPPEVVVLEGRKRVGGRVYSRPLTSQPAQFNGACPGGRATAEMGGMIITGFDRGNPLNVLVRGQLGLPYHNLRPDTTIYDWFGNPVDLTHDGMAEKLYNDCLDRVVEYKFKMPAPNLIEGNRELIDEARDSSAEGHKTIRQVEETTAAAAQVRAPRVAEDLVPVWSDRATGRVHVEPGTPGALKAAYKARLSGWTLKAGISEDDDVDLESAARAAHATLGTVMDHAIGQYEKLIEFEPQDYRLVNWHIANLEYSNAINYHQLSLQGWDIDAGNEWEGKHAMVIGGYQGVPRGLARFPTPLNLRHESFVKKITYCPGGDGGGGGGDGAENQATIECEDGYQIKADFVVNTIPLGVLKHGSVQFEPPLPSWKTNAIGRLGFGVLNKVVLVYKAPFWDQNRDIFGVLRLPLKDRYSLTQEDFAESRGRFFQWFNVSNSSGLPVLIGLMAGDAGFDTEQTSNDELIAEATMILRTVYGKDVPEPVEAVVTRWASDKFARGSYSSAGPSMKADDYDKMAAPVGNLYFAGEHTTGTHPATVHGAYLSGLRAASEVIDAILGPIHLPTPLVLPKETPASHKRKEPESKDTAQARQEAYEIEMWNHIVAQIGLRPLKPTKPCVNAYVLYSKANFEAARQRCEKQRRPGKGKASANEVRGMSSKMWKDAGPEERAPFEAAADEKKKEHAAAMDAFNAVAAEWDAQAVALTTAYQREHPAAGPTPEEMAAEEKRIRRSKLMVDSYAEPDDSDIDMAD